MSFASKMARKYDGKQITDKLEKKGPMGYNELFREVDSITSKGTFDNRINYLMEKGLIDKESAPPDTRSRVIVKLSPKATNPRYSTLRMLELSAGPHPHLDAEEAIDILTQKVSQTLVEICNFAFISKEKGFDLKPSVKKEVSLAPSGEIIASEGEPILTNIDQLKFLKGITRYEVEMECLKRPADVMSYPNRQIERLVWEKMFEKREDTSFFPALGTISKKDSESELLEKLEKLSDWSRPLKDSRSLASKYMEGEATNHLIWISDLLENSVKKKR